MSLVDRWAHIPERVRHDGLRAARERLGVPDLRDRRAWTSRDTVTSGALVQEAVGNLAEPWRVPSLQDYARFWRDGNRTTYEGQARAIRRRTSLAVMAAALTDEVEHLDAAADGLARLCEATTWCWAAHEIFATERGEVVPDPDRPYLDLGAAETVEIVAWADLVLGPALDERVPGLRRRLRREARIRVIDPFLATREWWWVGLTRQVNNWSPWIHGHVLAALLILEGDPTRREQGVERVVDGLDRYLASLPADGGCDEGHAYWWNGPERLVEALRLLDRVVDGALDPLSLPPLDEVLRYPQRMSLGDGWYVNVADAPARAEEDQPWHVAYAWAQARGDDGASVFARSHRTGPCVSSRLGLGRLLAGLFDGAWVAAEPANEPLPQRVWLPDVQLLVAREQAGRPDGLATWVKGGHNDENHNHLDIGAYVVAVDAVPVVIDIGKPTYTRETFSKRRYEQWVVRSEWHSTPTIGGHDQAPGNQHRAVDVEPLTSSDGDGLRLDLAPAYPPEAEVRSFTREVWLHRADAQVVTHDEWDTDAQVQLHHVLAGEPMEHSPGRLLMRTLGRGHVVLEWDSSLGLGHLEARDIDDAALSAVWGERIHRLTIDATGRDRFDLRLQRSSPA